MYVKVGNNIFRTILNLSFSPQTSILSEKVPINQFEVDVKTESDVLTVGTDAELYDDLNNLWAKYWLTKVQRIDASTVHILAESKLLLLERKEIAGVMYENYPVTSLLATLFSDLGEGSYYLHPSFQNATISGYMGHHSKKYRLQLVCFVLGAYIKSYFNDKIEILPQDTTSAYIPLNKTFWKPSVSYKDQITAVQVTSYSYEQTTREPETTESWVKVDDVVYIETSQEVTIANPNVDVTAPTNVMKVEDVQIINSSNRDAILQRLASYYFKGGTASLDVIDNAEYLPADKIIFHLSEDEAVTGIIESASFKFGLQARASLDVTPIEEASISDVVIRYTYNDSVLLEETYRFPVGYNFSIQTNYPEVTADGHRYVYRPDVSEATGTVQEETTIVEVTCQLAVDYYETVLSVYNVNAIDFAESEVDMSESSTGIDIVSTPNGTVDTNKISFYATVGEEE